MNWRTTVFLCLAGALGGCVALGKKDAFPVAGPPLDLPSLQSLAGPNSKVSRLEVSAAGHPLTAYYVRHPAARGVLILFGGSGNEVAASIKNLGPRAGALGLDLVVFSYYQQREAIPSVTAVRAEARAVYATVRGMGTPASGSVYLLGYSLGGWFALDLAASENVRGLILVGAETTPAEVIRKTDAPWASLIALRPDADAKQLDASLYAPRVRTPTLVVTSRQDEAVPMTVGQEVYDLLSASTPKRLVVLEGITHGRYFLSDEFWRQTAAFIRAR